MLTPLRYIPNCHNLSEAISSQFAKKVILKLDNNTDVLNKFLNGDIGDIEDFSINDLEFIINFFINPNQIETFYKTLIEFNIDNLEIRSKLNINDISLFLREKVSLIVKKLFQLKPNFFKNIFGKKKYFVLAGNIYYINGERIACISIRKEISRTFGEDLWKFYEEKGENLENVIDVICLDMDSGGEIIGGKVKVLYLDGKVKTEKFMLFGEEYYIYRYFLKSHEHLYQVFMRKLIKNGTLFIKENQTDGLPEGYKVSRLDLGNGLSLFKGENDSISIDKNDTWSYAYILHKSYLSIAFLNIEKIQETNGLKKINKMKILVHVGTYTKNILKYLDKDGNKNYITKIDAIGKYINIEGLPEKIKIGNSWYSLGKDLVYKQAIFSF